MVGGARVLGHLEGGHLADRRPAPGPGRARPASDPAIAAGAPVRSVARDREPSAADGARTSRSRARRPAPAPRGGSRRWCGRGSEARGDRGDLLAGGADLRVGHAEKHDLGIRTGGFDLVAAGQRNLARSGAEGDRQSALPTRPGPTMSGRGERGGVGCVRAASVPVLVEIPDGFVYSGTRLLTGPLPESGVAADRLPRMIACGPGPSPLRHYDRVDADLRVRVPGMRRALRGAGRRPAPARPGARPAEPRTPSAGFRPSGSATGRRPARQRRMEDRAGHRPRRRQAAVQVQPRQATRPRGPSRDRDRDAGLEAGATRRRSSARPRHARAADWRRPGTRSSSGPATPTPT